MSLETLITGPYTLPNGHVLNPGDRLRVSYDTLFAIPEEDIELYGLKLEDSKASMYTEVIYREFEQPWCSVEDHFERWKQLPKHIT